MKKRLSALLLAALLPLLSLPALADIIYVPEDDYVQKHYAECESVNRVYYVNGAEGYVLLQKSPEDGARVGAALNGTRLRVSFTHESAVGTLGLVEFTEDGGGWAVQAGYGGGSRTGWLPMAGLTVDYDSTAFQEEFAADLADWDGDLRGLRAGGETVFFTYPGSGESAMTVAVDDDIQFDKQYEDADGRIWARVGYYRAIRDCWVCLDDPGNGALPRTLDRTPELTAAQEPPASARPAMAAKTGVWVWWLGGGLALAAVAGTALILKRRGAK